MLIPIPVQAITVDSESIIIRVKATDNEGVVAAVEITIDGGKTWHPAARSSDDPLGRVWHRIVYSSAIFLHHVSGRSKSLLFGETSGLLNNTVST